MKTIKPEFFTLCDAERKAFYDECYCRAGQSWPEIAEKIGTYPNRVRRDATKLGIVSRGRADAQKQALRNGRTQHPTEGKSRSEEVKAKISESQGKIWDQLSKEEREYRSQIGLESWENKSDLEKQVFFDKSIKAIHKASKDGSKMENHIFKFLIKEGYRVAKHKEYILQNEKFHIDLYVPECRTAIEIDGPMHFEPVFGEHRLVRRRMADAAKTGLILSSGMALIRVKLNRRESQRYVREVKNTILELLEKLQEKFPPENERYFEV